VADNSESMQWSVVLSSNESGAYTHQKVSTTEQLTSIIQGASNNGLAIMTGKPAPLPPNCKQQAVVFADLTDLKSVLEDGLADQVIQVQTGMTVRELNSLLAQRRQWWPVEAAETATIMDVLHRGDGGCLEHGYGGPRDLVLGMNVVLGSGEAIKCGGRVVKNVSGYDIGKLFLGSRGWLGIIVSAHLRLYALPQTSITTSFQFNDLTSAYDAVVKLLHSGLPVSCLEVLSSSRWKDVQQSSPASEQDCMVVVRTQGMPEVAAEVSEAVRALLGSAQSATSIDNDEPLWQKLSIIEDNAVQLNCCAKDAVALIELSKSEKLHSRWQWRPSRGKLFVETKDKSSYCSALAGGKWHEPVTAGLSTDSLHYRVTRYPDDLVLSALKQRLKEQYDPSGIMNPFVAL
jgi:FAD/FMN-containing dehydrogenase